MSAPEPTKARLARVLREAGLGALAERAESGRFDDYASASATPCTDLVLALERAGRADLAARAREGEWDGTAAEAEAWAQSPEGRAVRASFEAGE